MRFVTISRKMGSGGEEIARQVADALGCTLYDTEAIEQTAQEMGFVESVREVDEKAPSLFQRILSHRPMVALERLGSVVYELASKGDAVFLGRGSHILLKSYQCGLHVKVTASRDTRIRNLVAKGYHKEAAAKAIDKSDHERSAFSKFAFGTDWDDPALYDLVINTDKLSIQLAAETVTTLARSGDIQSCSLDALRSIEMTALAQRVEAALLEADFAHSPTGAVTVVVSEPGKVCLTGFVEDTARKVRAEAVVKGVKGVDAVDNQLRLVPAGRYA